MTPSASAPWLAWTPRACEFCGGLGTYWRYVPRIDGGDVVMCASCKGLTVDAPEPVAVPDSIELAVALAGNPEGVARCPDAVVPSTEPCRFAGRSLGALADPFAPMLEVLAAGHAFDAFLDDAVVLVASPRTAPDVTPPSA